MNNEMNWIKSITPDTQQQPSLKVGIGDDAAIFSTETDMESVIAVDTMVEGVHFTKETMTMKALGHKALAVNVSDLAAMGAVPLYYLVSIAIPKTGWDKQELDDIYQGMRHLGNQFQMDLIGGDTVSTSKELVLTVTVVGKVEKDRHLLRSHAKPGDVLFVTGPLGLSAYGLEKLLAHGRKAADEATLAEYLKAHQYPQPRVKAGRVLAESGFKIALNDISDGIASEAMEIAQASGVRVTLHWEEIPTAPLIKEGTQEQQENWVLYGGEDFELVGTVSEADLPSLEKMFTEQGLPFFPIGRIEASDQPQVVLERNKGEVIPLTKTGYDHL
ncbi:MULTISPECIES: thiamine-phosphate kinase [Bacillaceae]|uniref:Thiamine-monophosphate kinase n=1 Tax=Evansella alkalicola TaxID=745819 RepID=A0ABS6JYL2_9BACI|nr:MULTISPECIES: thiamine-phosphate kinase [Bacillaceae]MBU9723681.1 thiamine-phosphate kinase [Bacillus alkalicola]